MSLLHTRSLAALTAVAALAVGGAVPVAFARGGADDPPSHDAGDDHGGQRGRGADDPAGDDRGGKRLKVRAARHGADDGPNHDAGDDHGRRGRRGKAHAARHGADDRPGDDRRGRGRGGDDGPNHR